MIGHRVQRRASRPAITFFGRDELSPFTFVSDVTFRDNMSHSFLGNNDIQDGERGVPGKDIYAKEEIGDLACDSWHGSKQEEGRAIHA